MKDLFNVFLLDRNRRQVTMKKIFEWKSRYLWKIAVSTRATPRIRPRVGTPNLFPVPCSLAPLLTSILTQCSKG